MLNTIKGWASSHLLLYSQKIFKGYWQCLELVVQDKGKGNNKYNPSDEFRKIDAVLHTLVRIMIEDTVDYSRPVCVFLAITQMRPFV